MTRTTAVLLAAGAGTRLGLGPKALLPFRGATLVAHAAGELLRGGCAEVLVVIGAGADQVRATPMPAGCRFVFNPRWAEGMGTSFALGVHTAQEMHTALEVHPAVGAPTTPTGGACAEHSAEAAEGAEAAAQKASGAGGTAAPQPPILVALVDQPGMDAALISLLIALHRPGRITAAGYRSGHGAGAGTGTGKSGGLRRGNPVLFAPEHASGAAALAAGDSAARAYLSAHPDLVDVVDVSGRTDGADIDTAADLHLLE